MTSTSGRILAAAALPLLAGFLVMACSSEKPVIKLHLWEGSESLQLNNAVAEFIIEKGYGLRAPGS